MKLTKSEAIRIGGVMKRVREMQHYTMEQMADMADATVRQIGDWESGKLGLESARYVKIIFDIGSRYKARVLPNYFKEYYMSDHVQESLEYFSTFGYDVRKMRKTLKISLDAMSKELSIAPVILSDVERNSYVDPKNKQRYVFYLYARYAKESYVVPPSVLSYILGYYFAKEEERQEFQML